MTLVAQSRFVDDLHPSPNVEPRRYGLRPDLLLLHYTGMHSVDKAIDWLSRPESRVSCHYVIAVDGRITQMVSEELRAWHAGISCWAGETDINSCSIGLEIHNPGHDLGYPDFPAAQMHRVRDLCRDIVERWRIVPERVLAHSDVAHGRKIDPGEKFDWRFLAEAGVGRWVEPCPLTADDPSACETVADIAAAQHLLASYGYAIRRTDGAADAETRSIVRAFQRHFRPARVDGIVDHSTLATLRRLVPSTPSA